MSRQEASPSLQDWKGLYEAAISFKGIECWDWMWDSDVFGVQDPVSGEIGYCPVMGRAREHFGLAVYLGSEGLAGYLQIQSGKIPEDPVEALALQKCLSASFEDRRYLDKPDLEVIKQLGLKFRGSSAWPLFRSYRPGFRPWYLTKSEAEFLTIALQQTVEVALRFKENPDLLTSPSEEQFFVRVPKRKEGGWEWHDEWLELAPLPPTKLLAMSIDERRSQRLTETARRVKASWEIDFFYFPESVKEKGDERPYYPHFILYVDSHSGFVLDFGLARHGELASELVEKFLQIMENLRVIPSEVLVRKEEAFILLNPLATHLGFDIIQTRRLPAFDAARKGMGEFMRR